MPNPPTLATPPVTAPTTVLPPQPTLVPTRSTLPAIVPPQASVSATTTTQRVPPSHFRATNDISFGPPAADDDISITSVHSILAQFQTNQQKHLANTKLQIPTLSIADLLDADKTNMWFTKVKAELSANQYYKNLLSNNNNEITINYATHDSEADSKLFSVLAGKLTDDLLLTISNCDITTGTSILRFIDKKHSRIAGNSAREGNIVQDYYSIKWNPHKEDLPAFNQRYQSLHKQVRRQDHKIPFTTAKSVWIKAMPTEFTALIERKNKNQLDANWTIHCTDLGDLLFSTQCEMENSDITFTKSKITQDASTSSSLRMNIRNLDQAIKNGERGKFPDEFPTYSVLRKEITKLKQDGKTRDEITAQFKPTHSFPNCWLCRIKNPRHALNHKDVDCLILKSIFDYPVSLTTCVECKSHTVTQPSSPTSVCQALTAKPQQHNPTPTSDKCCYDSGTWPLTLCSNTDYFTELVYFDTPKYVEMAECGKLGRVLGQGMIDVIIKNEHRIQMFAYLTENTAFLMSAADHLKYAENNLHGSDGTLTIQFGTTTFKTYSSDRFEFDVQPGKTSNHQIDWTPSAKNIKQSCTHNDVKVMRLHEDAMLPQKAPCHNTGLELSSSRMSTIKPGHHALIPLGFSMAYPDNLHCELRPRRSLSSQGINISLPNIDNNYRGEITATVKNDTSNIITIALGQRIGTLLFQPIPHTEFPSITNLPNSSITKQAFTNTHHPRYISNRVHRHEPSLSTIMEVDHPTIRPSHPKDPELYSTHINHITHFQLNQLISHHQSNDIEDVTPPARAKLVNPDAIHLFPKEMYHNGQLHILGTPDDYLLQPSPKGGDSNPTQQPSTHPHPILLLTNFPHDFTPAPTKPTTIVPEYNIPAYFDIPETNDTPIIDNIHDHTSDLDVQDSTIVHSVLQSQANIRIPPQDRVSSTEPKMKVMTTEYLQKCLGFRNISSVLKNLDTLAKDTITIRDTGCHPIRSRGETATLPKKNANTSAIPKPPEFGQVWHFDIIYGNGRAIGGIQYGLFFVDRFSRYKILIGLLDLSKQQLRKAMKKFIRILGFYPRELIADRDFRLIGDNINDLLEPHTQVSGAPGGRQSQNGLSEANWKYICNTARGYLVEHLLSPEYWFFSLLYAVQSSNYMGIKTDKGTLTTPFFLAFKIKPDYRKLLPLFSAAYVKIYQSAQGNTFTTQTVKCILVGNDEKSDGRLFYNPVTKSIISSSDFTLNATGPSGPLFNVIYQEPTTYSLYQEKSTTFKVEFELGSNIHISPTNADHPGQPATILNVPFNIDEPYTVQIKSTLDIIDVTPSNILDYNPTEINTNDPTPSLEYPWIKDKAKATVFIPSSMKTPKQGLLIHKNDTWFFHTGRTLKSKSVRNNSTEKLISLATNIPDLEALIQICHVNKNWLKSKTVTSLQNTVLTGNIIARRVTFMNSSSPHHLSDKAIQAKVNKTPIPDIIGFANRVSAKNLTSLHEPKLHEHSKLSTTDKAIWDQSYLEEYMGLHQDTQTWEYITEAEYQDLKKVIGRVLPTMALSKIKKDENGNPDRAKYRIVVLGNLDPHEWTPQECFAPVLSPLELRMLVAISAQLKTIPKTGDVAQAFVQSVLPQNEKYVIKPPKGCPITPPKTLMLLKKTLYGLKRSPRHWFETCKKTLISLGLHPLPNAPCIFTGTLIPGEPPLYLGLYVDDFIYFSSSPKVEAHFEKQFGKAFKVDFTPEIQHFLGVKFTNVTHLDGNVDIYMTQEADILNLIKKVGLDKADSLTAKTPYRSGYPVDTIPHIEMSVSERNNLNKTLQELVGSLTWLSTITRPDIATITNILSQYNHNCSPGHIDAAKYVIRYLKGSSKLGLCFSSKNQPEIEGFVQFPIDPKELQALTDANWGPQDQSVPYLNAPIETLDLFKTRSIAGYIIWLGGPLDWSAKRQTFTARSSAHAEIGAVDDCTKTIQHIRNLLTDLNMFQKFTKGPITIYNDNQATVQWSHNMTTKGLRYIQIRENAVREQVQAQLIQVKHIGGIHNSSDIFTKEDKDITHYLHCRDSVQKSPPDQSETYSSIARRGVLSARPSVCPTSLLVH